MKKVFKSKVFLVILVIFLFLIFLFFKNREYIYHIYTLEDLGNGYTKDGKKVYRNGKEKYLKNNTEYYQIYNLTIDLNKKFDIKNYKYSSVNIKNISLKNIGILKNNLVNIKTSELNLNFEKYNGAYNKIFDKINYKDLEILNIQIKKYPKNQKLLNTIKTISKNLEKYNLKTLNFDIEKTGRVMSGYNNYKLDKNELDILKNLKVKEFSYIGFFGGSKVNENGKEIGNPEIIKFLEEAKYIEKIISSEIGKINIYVKENGKVKFYPDK